MLDSNVSVEFNSKINPATKPTNAPLPISTKFSFRKINMEIK